MDHPGEVIVTGTGPDALAQEVIAGPHGFLVDEPVALGGAETGPTPYDLLLAALGSCTAITLRLYAKRKGWPLRNVTVALRHARVHVTDCAGCETAPMQVEEIRRTLTLEGPLDQDQRARLLEIADKCPVHRTLEGRVHVRTSLAA